MKRLKVGVVGVGFIGAAHVFLINLATIVPLV